MNGEYTNNYINKKTEDILSFKEENISDNNRIPYYNNNQYNVGKIGDINNTNNVKSDIINQFLSDLDNKSQNKIKNFFGDLDENNSDEEDEFEKAEREYYNKKNIKYTNEKIDENNFSNNKNPDSKKESPHKLKTTKKVSLFPIRKIINIPAFTKQKDFYPKLIAHPGEIYLNASLKKGANTFRKKINSKPLLFQKNKHNKSTIINDYYNNHKYLSKNIANKSNLSNNDISNNKNLQFISGYKQKKNSFNNTFINLNRTNSNELIFRKINNKKTLKINKHNNSSMDIRSVKNNNKYDNLFFCYKSKTSSLNHLKDDFEGNLTSLDPMKYYLKNKKSSSLLNSNNFIYEIFSYYSKKNLNNTKYNPYSLFRLDNNHKSKLEERNYSNDNYLPYIHD